MLITKFNKLIRNKMLWAVFALLVCFSFVFGSLVGRGGGNDRSAGTAGELFGEEVPAPEFLRARFYELGLRERPGLDPEANAKLRRQTWKRLAVLKQADDMGLTVTPAEIADVIQRDPTFHVNGVFSKDRYRQLIQQQLRIGIQMFEEYVRQDILMRKVMQTVQSMVWIAPEDVSRRLENLTDEFQLEYTVMMPDALVEDVDTSEEAARNYYDAHPESFREPEAVRVRYVAFPVANYTGTVAVSQADASEYYDMHRTEFVPETSTNETAEPLPFEEVEDLIVDTLTQRKATFEARDDAMNLVLALTPGRYAEGLPLDEAVLERGMTLATTEYFTVSGPVPGLDDAGSDFVSAAFELDADSEDAYFSDPIVGHDAVYVIAAHERRETYVPEFEQVADEAEKAAEAEAKHHRLIAEANAIRAAALETTHTLADAVAPYGIPVSTTEVFTVYDSSEDDLPYSDVVLPAIMDLREGEYTDCLPVSAGVFLGHVRQRRPGDIASAELLRPQLLATLSRYRAGMIYQDWTDNLLARGGLKDYAERPAPGTEEG